MTMTTFSFGRSVNLVVHIITVPLRLMVMVMVMLMRLMRLIVIILGVAPRRWLILRTRLEVVWVLRLEMRERLWRLSYVGVADDLRCG